MVNAHASGEKSFKHIFVVIGNVHVPGKKCLEVDEVVIHKNCSGREEFHDR